MVPHENTSNSASAGGLLSLAIGFTYTFLAIQWLFVSGFELGVGPDDAARTLLGLAIVGLFLGVIAGILAIISKRLWADSSVALPIVFALAILVFLEATHATVSVVPGLAFFPLAIAAGVVVSMIMIFVQRYLPESLLRAETWWLTAAASFLVALVLTAVNVVDMVGEVTALGGAAAGALLLFVAWRSHSHRTAYAMVSIATVIGASAFAATRVPIYAPDVAITGVRPSILLITIDTLRADHVGAYGYAEARTPNMDALASEGVLFAETVAASYFTGPSHTSILTGLLPENHAVLTNGARIPDSIPTLADILRKEGYITGAFVSAYTTQNKTTGLPSRFHAFDDDIRAFHLFPRQAYFIAALGLISKTAKFLGFYQEQFYRMGAETTDTAIAWLNTNGDRPFFVWTHLFDPHLPYHPPREYLKGLNTVAGHPMTFDWTYMKREERTKIIESPEIFAQMIALYDAEIAYADEQVGRLVSAARRVAPKNNLIVIVTADHGESQGEHEMFWERDLYDPSLLVPLIIVTPKGSQSENQHITEQVRLIDLAPTIVEMTGSASASEFNGDSLVKLIKGRSEERPRPALSQIYTHPNQVERVRQSIRAEGWKLIRRYPGWDGAGPERFEPGVTQELFNLQVDPGETMNLIGAQPGILPSLSAALDAHVPAEKSAKVELSPEDQAILKSLGYIR